MERDKLTKAEELLEEIAEFLNENMRWITQRRIQDKDLNIESHDDLFFNIHCEMKGVYDKIQKYLEEE